MKWRWISADTVRRYGEVLKTAKSVVWNGPAGVFETKPFDKGTVALAELLGALDAEVVIGGGDSAAAITPGRPCRQDEPYFIRRRRGFGIFRGANPLPAIQAIEEV